LGGLLKNTKLENMMIKLREKGTDKPIGNISEEQLQFLIDELEEEWLEDRDYSITKLLLNFFESREAQPELVALLREAMGDRDEMEIIWSR
jgi:hypothetical protein